MSKSDEDSSEVLPTAGDNEEPKKASLVERVARVQDRVSHEQEFYFDSSSDGGFIAYDRKDKWRTVHRTIKDT